MPSSTDDTTRRIQSLLPAPTPTNRGGGTHTHKPNCQCNPCKARARREEALPVPTGDGGPTLASDPALETGIINADEIIVAPPVGRNKAGRSKRAIIAEWIKHRTIEPDITNIEIARKLGISKPYLYSVINTATREGWLTFDDPLARIEHQIIPKALDNLNHFLQEGDKQVTIEVAKGTIFKSYQEAKGLNQASHTVLALKIELPSTGTASTEIIEGQIVGQPKVLMDASKVDVDALPKRETA